jgi:glutaredoxin/glutathione-dependent peroxiredoxin
MSIRPGDAVPSARFKTIDASGIRDVDSDSLFHGRKVAVFGLPGAYTPVCSAQHLPGYVENFAKLKAAGFDEIACISVNDPFVMAAWGKEHGADGKVSMLCDSDGAFTSALGLVADLGKFGLHGRSERYAMVVDNGIVKKLDVEKTVFDHDGTSAVCMLKG